MNDQAATFARRKARIAGLICFVSTLAGVLFAVYRAPRSHAAPKPASAQAALRPDISPAANEASTRAHWMRAYARLPLSFEANQGQADSRVRFLARGQGYSLLLTGDQANLALRSSAAGSTAARPGDHARKSTLEMKLEGANPHALVRGTDELPGKSNYFVGNDPAKWRTGVPTYARVRYQGVYPGIDLVYYGTQGQLEYDFVVGAGADPSAINLRIAGADHVRLNAEGDLVLEAQGGQAVFRQPMIYQANNGARRKVSGGYALGKASADGAREVRFRVGRYDHSQALVIDPTFSYSTYLGGNQNDYVYAVATDSSGAAYVAGYTYSTNFATLSPFQSANNGAPDAFVTKLNAAGSALVYSTYIGGTSYDQANALALDGAGHAFVTGITYSTNFPTTSGVFQTTGNSSGDAYVLELAASGSSLVYSTYLGGSGNNSGNGIGIDGLGYAYVTGNTSSTDFPLAGAYQSTLRGSTNAFVSKVAPGGTRLVYSTYFGGSGSDFAYAVAVDAPGNPYIAGQTTSNDFPTANAFQPPYKGGTDAFVAKLIFSGSKVTLGYSTYLGGTSSDQAYSIALDSSRNAYVTGATSSTNFPILNAFQATFGGGGSDAFVAKLDSTGSKLIYSTYLGGNAAEAIQGFPKTESVAVDSKGKAYVAGITSSTNFPLANPVQSTISGSQDAFVTVLNPMGCGLSFSTLLGGSSTDYATSVAVDTAGDAIVGGATQSNDFFTAKPFQVATGGNDDGFVAKLPTFTAPSVCLSPNSITFPAETSMTTSQPMNVTLTNAGDDALDITSIAATGPYGETNTCGSSIAAGQNCTISVTFSPITAALGQAGLVTVTDNAAGVSGATQSIALTGDGADFQLQVSPTTSSVTAGQKVNYTLTLVSSAKFADTVALSCNGVPAPGACTITPASITAMGGTNATATVSVTTVAKSSVPPGPLDNGKPPFMWLVILLAAGLLAAAAWARHAPARRAWVRLATVAGIVLLVAVWFGCGVSNPAPNFTVPGNYTVQITGTDGPLTHTVSANLTVQ